MMRLDAISYMRRRDGRVRKLRDAKGRVVKVRRQGRARVFIGSIEAIAIHMSDNESEVPMDPFRSDVGAPSEKSVAGELRQRLLVGLTRIERLTLTMTWDGFTCLEIGQVAGYSESWISKVRMRVTAIALERAKRWLGQKGK